VRGGLSGSCFACPIRRDKEAEPLGPPASPPGNLSQKVWVPAGTPAVPVSTVHGPTSLNILDFFLSKKVLRSHRFACHTLQQPMDASVETEMVKQCRRGETRAWDDLFDLHYSATARFLANGVVRGRPEDIEEICQETFLAVVRNLRAFHGQSRLQTWIFRIAMNKAETISKNSRRPNGVGEACCGPSMPSTSRPA